MSFTALSAAIMAVPSRLEAAERLRDQLADDSRVLGVSVSVDTSHRGPRHGAAAAWATRRAHASHHLVVQDDAILCDGFLDRAIEAIEAQPVSILSFQLARTYGAAGAPVPSWVRPNKFIGAIAVAMPSDAAMRAVEWLLRDVRQHNDDESLWRFVQGTKIDFRVTCPSLVQHAEFPSTCGHDFLHPRLRSVHFLDDLTPDERRFSWRDARDFHLSPL